MNNALNLLPRSVLQAHHRARRGRRWSVLAGCLAAGMVASWTLRVGSLWQQESWSLQALEVQRRAAGASRQAAELRARLTELHRELSRLVELRRRDDWPARYAELATAAPPGVVLTQLSVSGPEPTVVAGGARATATPAPSSQPAAPRGDARFRMVAYASDHARMLEFIAAVQRLAGCREVELVSTAADDRYPGLAVRFECAGRNLEARP